jgi:RNA polymerase sigma-70 factor (ECF subfamily)
MNASSERKENSMIPVASSALDHNDLGRHTDYLIAFAERRLADREAARDAVQDTFLAALRSTQQDGFAGRSSVRTWLTGILKHKIADNFRDRYAFSAVADSDEVLESIPMAASQQPEARFESARMVAIANRQLDEMPARTAQAFMMTEIEGDAPADVARRLGVSDDYLSVMRFRARRSLQGALREAVAA